MKKKILVIEDEPSIADNIVYALNTEGFSARWASTASEGRQQLTEDSYNLVVLDVGLPDENGFELAKDIRNQNDLPIIFVTARGDEVDRVVGLEIGADDYIVKPFSPRELCARVRAVLRRTEVRASSNAVAELFVGAFVVDQAKLLITYHGQALDLSRYEFRILQILIATPGRVYSRGQLMEIAWEEPDMSLERTVDTHVKTLRQKLRAVDAAIDPIVTHRGVGYSLKEPE